MIGDYVIVRCHGDKPALNRVYEELGNGFRVCNPDRYEDVVKGYERAPTIGFPRNDVYCYDAEKLAFIEANYSQGDAAWYQLPLYWRQQERQTGASPEKVAQLIQRSVEDIEHDMRAKLATVAIAYIHSNIG